IQPGQLSVLDRNFKRVVEPGRIEIAVGGTQPEAGDHVKALSKTVLTGTVRVVSPAGRTR
ncbi:MAG: hypothetical protein ABSA30_11440, partial [Candidatus Aminicenantales bacterium]